MNRWRTYRPSPSLVIAAAASLITGTQVEVETFAGTPVVADNEFMIQAS